MKKNECVLREILVRTIEGERSFQQKNVSKICTVSIGLVNKTVKKLEAIGAVQIRKRGFSVVDLNKILLFWATRRSIEKEALKFYVDLGIEKIEKTLPSCAIFTAFSGWRLLTGRTPADYREVVVYVSERDKDLMDKWLKENKSFRSRPANVFVIYTKDTHLIKNSKKNIAPIPQIFVDIYSLGSLSSKYFLKDMLEKYPNLDMGV